MPNLTPIIPDHGVFHALPHPLLSPFINQYTFRSIVIPTDCYVEKAMPLRLTSSIDFFIGDAFDTIDCLSGEVLPFLRATVRGPRTFKKYHIRLQGQFISFTIKFHATGIYKLLGMPMDKLRDKALSGSSIPALPFEKMTTQLLYARDIKTCIDIVEPCLLQLASRYLPVASVAEQAVRHLLLHNGRATVAQLANNSNLSIRQLERIFAKEIGVSPKTYSRMLRFLHLLNNKTARPNQKWTALAHDANYFDQMHLVKEFKQFLGTTPSAYVPADFAF